MWDRAKKFLVAAGSPGAWLGLAVLMPTAAVAQTSDQWAICKNTKYGTSSSAAKAAAAAQLTACNAIIASGQAQGKDLADAYVGRGSSYLSKLSLGKAMADFDMAIQLNPQDAWAYFYRGVAYFAKLQSDHALPEFTRAIELDPTLAAAYHLRAGIYQEKGNKQLAIADYQRALQLDPQNSYDLNQLLRLGGQPLPPVPPAQSAEVRQGPSVSTTTALASVPQPSATNASVSPQGDSDPTDATADAVLPPLAAATAASTGPRVALVIGVGTYGALGDLSNPPNDAKLVAAALRRDGFEVQLVINPDQRKLYDAVHELGDRMVAAGADATGLFYYAGHGVQSKGVNYLIPSHAKIFREADLVLEAVPADAILAQMEDAKASTNIIILDACRNTPFSRSLRSGARGLAQMDAPNGSFIAYSTAPGSVAADGTGANSPFALALARELGQPGELIEAVFRNVRRTVLQQTDGQQTPWDSSSLTDPFYFKQPPEAAHR